MPEPLTPAEEFRDAARIVREYAERATEGPWLAMFTDPTGDPITYRQPGFDDGNEDEQPDETDAGFLSLLAGTALPGEDGSRPGSYQTVHVLAEHDDDLNVDEAGELYGSLEWAALLNPLIAEPLAAAFDSAADDAEQVGADYRLLEVARLTRSQHEAIQGGEQS